MNSPTWIVWCGDALAAAAAAYAITAVVAARVRLKVDSMARRGQLPGVTILKPLCGDEHDLFGCLKSFFDQDYPSFEIIFGVSDSEDPAIDVVRRLQAEFPHIDAKLVIDRRQHGSSRKVSNLINMLPFARRDYLVVSDSDVRVSTDYLSRVVPPLLDPEVGVVTCAYRGAPRRGLWSLLGSMFINDWFIPSVRVSALFGSREFAFGVTIAMRRQVLSRVGGLAAIADQLADDYRLGELTRARGLRTVLSDVVVETCVDERSFGALLRHELRWLRTIRAVRPTGYALTFVTFGAPVAWFGCVLAGATAFALTLFVITVVGRLVLHLQVRNRGSSLVVGLLVLPLREVLSLVLWGWGFVTRRVYWRDARLHITRDGSVQPVVRITQ